jgi:hypothetical protein
MTENRGDLNPPEAFDGVEMLAADGGAAPINRETRRKAMKRTVLAACALICAAASTAVPAQQKKPKMAMDIPAAITTPDSVDTRLGTLKFFDGLPDKNTVEKVYDNLDVQRGVQAFLNAMPGASLAAMRKGLREAGVTGNTIGIFETLLDPKSLFLTGNTETLYVTAWLDLKNGPVVVESPPNSLGIMDDFWFRYVTDMGLRGLDQGQGGKFLFLPPDYTGDVPIGYFVFRSRTYGNWLVSRGFLVNGDVKPTVENFKQHIRMYPFAQAANPPEQQWVNLSGQAFNTIHANDVTFYEEVNTVVQEEPADALDAETLGLLASIGIEKGKPFAPDTRMKKILTDAAAVGNATARALTFRSRDATQFYYPNSAWFNPFVGASFSHEFLNGGALDLDARTSWFYQATGITPAMVARVPGSGSQYAIAAVDSRGEYLFACCLPRRYTGASGAMFYLLSTTDGQGKALDGAKTYRLHVPASVPVKDF